MSSWPPQRLVATSRRQERIYRDEGIYVVACAGDSPGSHKYYIEYSTDIDTAFRRLLLPRTTSRVDADPPWLDLYPPQRLVARYSDAHPFDIFKYVLLWMADHGIDAVRGGPYSKTTLSSTERGYLRGLLDQK